MKGEHRQLRKGRVLVFGDFDVLHPGHLHFLREAKKMGDALTVVVTRSAVIRKLKGRAPLFGDAHRMETVRMLSIVDAAMLGDAAVGSFRVIEKQKPDVICLGHDQRAFATALRSYLHSQGLKIPLKRISAYDPKSFKSEIVKKFIAGEVCLTCRI